MHSGDEAAATPNQPADTMAPAPSSSPLSAEDRQAAREVLTTEYNVLMSALNAAWSASLTRTSLFLGVLSAAGVAFGFAAQGGVDPATFRAVALLVLALVLFLGIATFIRLVQVQRESMVYITGMNRIRHFFLNRPRPAARTSCFLFTTTDRPSIAAPGPG